DGAPSSSHRRQRLRCADRIVEEVNGPRCNAPKSREEARCGVASRRRVQYPIGKAMVRIWCLLSMITEFAKFGAASKKSPGRLVALKRPEPRSAVTPKPPTRS